MKRNSTAGKRLLAFLLTLAMLAGMLAFVPAMAEDAPAPLPDKYVIDGVTYYNVDSPNFDVQKKFFKDLISAKSPELGNLSIGDLWMLAAVGLNTLYMTGKTDSEKKAAKKAILEGYVGEPVSGIVVKEEPKWVNSGDSGYVEQSMKVLSFNGVFKHTVRFSDFKVTAVLPDAKAPNSYVSVSDTDGEETSYSLGARNDSATDGAEVTQTLKDSYSGTVSSSVNQSKKYAFEESVQWGFEFKFFGMTSNISFGFKATEEIQNGWEETTSETREQGIDHSTVVPMEPYTVVRIVTTKGTTNTTTDYNCAIGLSYKVSVINEFASLENADFFIHVGGDYTFDADARKDLNQRAFKEGSAEYDKQRIDWLRVLADGDIKDAIQKITTHVPMSATGASFTSTLKSTLTSIDGKSPIYPLAYLTLAAPKVPYISQQEVTYGVYKYLRQTMNVGDASYTNYLQVEGWNDKNAPYFGFSKKNGHWVVADGNGVEMKPEDAPVTLETSSAYGECCYTAVKPGTCYLKYVINEDCYSSADRPDVFATNDSLEFTAALRIDVVTPEVDATPVVIGSYMGIVDAAEDSIEGKGKLQVRCYDSTGKGVKANYTWESQDLPEWGIQLSSDGKVTFTEAGTYKVRARCGKNYSDWVEITAEALGGYRESERERKPKVTVEAYSDSEFVVRGGYRGVVDAKPESIENSYIDCKGLSVKVYDGTGKQIPAAITWEAREKRGIELTPKGKVSFTKPGTYHVRACSGKYHSAWVKITATRQPRPETLFTFSRNISETVNAGKVILLTVEGSTIERCSSSNTDVAVVDDNGILQTLNPGKVKITVVTTDGKKLTLKLKVQTPVPPEKVTIEEGKKVKVKLRERLALTALLTPANAVATLTWTTSDKKVAKVDALGNVTAVSEGAAKITVTTDNGKSASIKVKVVAAAPEGVTIENGKKATLYAGDLMQLVATVSPRDASQAVTWTSSKSKVAKVDENGLVTAVAPGKAKITATTLDGKKSATITITVQEVTNSASLSPDATGLEVRMEAVPPETDEAE